MSDLISRQDAIKTIKDADVFVAYHEKDPIDEAVDEAIRATKRSVIYDIEMLPSAQPERAIKDCRNCKHGNYNDHWDTYFCYHSGDCNDWDKWEPSAESEIIRCKNCKHRDSNDCPMYYEEWIEIDEGDGYFDTDTIIHDPTTDEGFCHCAELRGKEE